MNGPAQGSKDLGPETEGVRVTRDGGVAVLAIHAPPVNAMGRLLRAELDASLKQALADPAIQAIVIAAEGRHFSGGADIREFDQPADPAVPLMPAICDRVELAGKPVIAAIQGSALGAGLELALSCHLRIAGPQARFGLPEVGLGLCPGAGGTQRLPRLIGAQAALSAFFPAVIAARAAYCLKVSMHGSCPKTSATVPARRLISHGSR